MAGKDFFHMNKIGALLDSLGMKYPCVYLTLPIPRLARNVASTFPKRFLYSLSVLRKVIRNPQLWAPAVSSRLHTYIFSKSRWHDSKFLQIWPKDFKVASELPRVLRFMEMFVVA